MYKKINLELDHYLPVRCWPAKGTFIMPFQNVSHHQRLGHHSIALLDASKPHVCLTPINH